VFNLIVFKSYHFQKKRRDDFLNHARNLVQGSFNKDEDTDDEIESEPMEVEERKLRKYKPKPLRKSYKDQLMQSEWLVDVPEDFSENWTAVLCPVGRRSLIVAGDGKTLHFSRSGHFVSCFQSMLPGGRRVQSNSGLVTLLDCIHLPEKGVFYVLDAMAWGVMSLYDCDTQFRRFWISSKLEETPDLGRKARSNQYPFLFSHSFDCDKAGISTGINQDLDYDLDGILFYHKHVHYLPGHTPLVGWLKAYMVPDMFGVPVHEKYLLQAPSNYKGRKTISDNHDSYIANRQVSIEMKEESVDVE
jgi:snurportin-1